MRPIQSIVMAAVILMTASAYAAVTFNNVDGSGSIGKGDVMTALGYKGNVQIPTPAFRYTDHIKYTQSCVKDLQRNSIDQDFQRRRNIDSNIVYDTKHAKGNDNVAGYTLSGFGSGAPQGIPSTLCNVAGGWYPDPNDPLMHVIQISGGNLTVSDGLRVAVLWPAPLPWGYCDGGTACN